jgi:hypothetical protein
MTPASPSNAALESAILTLLAARAPGKTICPSEVARQIAAAHPHLYPTPESWRTLMQPTREAAIRLAQQGRILITQHSRPVAPSAIHGPIRLRLP